MTSLYRNDLLCSTSSGWAEGLEVLGLSRDRWSEAVLADAHQDSDVMSWLQNLGVMARMRHT